MNITKASTQWQNRPDDERFESLLAMNDHLQALRSVSLERVVSAKSITVVPKNDGYNGLGVLGKTDTITDLTHWSMGQLAYRAGAPAGYLRSLPAPIAADCLNIGLQRDKDQEYVGALLSISNSDSGPNTPVLRALTGPQYGRIWNATISQALVDRFGDGLTGDFRVPGEFGKQTTVTKANTTIYASDRDMFVFLADEKNKIELPNRRDGKAGLLSRGFFVWNSEVGASTFGVATFLFDYVCANRIVWGANEYKEIKIRHTANAPEKWIEEITPTLEQYAQSSTLGITQAIAAARNSRVEKVEDFLKSRFTERQTTRIIQAHATDEGRPMENLWDIATGITAFARDIGYQDERILLERKAGLILNMAL